MDEVAEGMAPGPDGSFLRFFYDSIRNEQATIAEGRAIFDTALFVDVITPGQKSSTPRFELERVWSDQSCKALGLSGSKRTYKYAEYQEQAEKYKRLGEAVDLGGTPLKMWPRIDRGLAATLAVVHIHTVEALAAVSDSNLDNLGLGGRELREQARTFLAQSAGGADLSQLTERLSTAERENRRLTDALAEANRVNATLQAQDAKPKKPTDLTLTAG
jgi:hypothetical protein